MAIIHPCSVNSADEASEMIESVEFMTLPVSVSSEYPDPDSAFFMDPYGYTRKPDVESPRESSIMEASESDGDDTAINDSEQLEEDSTSASSIKATDYITEVEPMDGMKYSYDDHSDDTTEESEDSDRYGYTNLSDLI